MSHPMTDDVVTAALSLVPCIHAAREEGEATRLVPPALAAAFAIDLYRAIEMTFWLPQVEVTLAQIV